MSGVSVVAEFHQVDALPRAEGEAAVGDGNGERDADDGGLGVAGHVVRALVGVDKDLSLVVGDDVVESGGHVCAHVRIAVLVERDGGGRVLQEEVDGADGVLLEGGHVADNLVGDEVAAAGTGGEGKLVLFPSGRHCWLDGEVRRPGGQARAGAEKEG